MNQSQTDPPSLFEPPTSLQAVRPLRIAPIASHAEGRLWNAFIARCHYLGHHPLPDARMRYFVRATNAVPLAVLGFIIDCRPRMVVCFARPSAPERVAPPADTSPHRIQSA